MKKRLFFMGLISFMLVLVLAGCPQPTDNDDKGTQNGDTGGAGTTGGTGATGDTDGTGGTGGETPAPAPGSSSTQAIQIPSGGIAGSLSSGSDVKWYKFYVTSQGSYHILDVSDHAYSHTYTADIVVDLYDDGLNLIQSNVNLGSGTNASRIKGNWDAGQWYVKVRARNNSADNAGTFAIFFV
jgi:hypothetical protein